MFKYQIKGETRKITPKHTLNAPNTELMPAVSSTLSLSTNQIPANHVISGQLYALKWKYSDKNS